jgi:hypothetical protein
MASKMKQSQPSFSLGNMFGDVGTLLGAAFHDLTAIMTAVDHTPIVKALTHMIYTVLNHKDSGVRNILKHPGNIELWFGETTTSMGTPFVDAFMVGGMGANPDFAENVAAGMGRKPPHDWQNTKEAFRVDTRPGLNALARMVGFILTTNITFAVVGLISKFVLAQRYHEGVDRMLGGIGEQLGLGWASGTALSGLFETAMLPPLEESINVQFHPRRLDMMLLRQLARQHHINLDEFWAGLDLQGYPDSLKALILKMDTNQLLPADLQALWALGTMSRDGIKAYLRGVGYSDTDIEHLLTLWVDHAETQELALYRTEIRTVFLEGKITKEQFKDAYAELMQSPHTPSNPPWLGKYTYASAPEQIRMNIDMAVANAEFAIEWGRTSVTAAQVEKLLKAGEITDGEARKRLRSLGYDDADIHSVMQVFKAPPLAGKPGVTSAKILAYTKSGVFTNSEAYHKLMALGMDAKDAEFLAWNPDVKAGPWYPPFNVGTIIAAYIDGTLETDEVKPKLEQAGLNPEEAALEAERAYHTIYYSQHPKLMTAKEESNWQHEWITSLKTIYAAGGIGDQEAVNLMMEAGLGQSDAGIIWAGWYQARHGKLPGAPMGAA